MKTTEFAVAQGINDMPAFNCWVKDVLKKRDKIIASIRKQQTRYLKSHKFGIELPKTVNHALMLDAKYGNTLWTYHIKRMRECKNDI